jgi:peptidoglycan-N-acetylglucosamine deacetylase
MELDQQNHSKTFLFSIDLEDVRMGVENGNSFKDRVPNNTRIYLKWLDENKFKCTFFITGHVGEKHPDLIDEIIQQGHEIACHTTKHIPLEQYTKEELYEDLVKNISVLKQAGVNIIKGFRAPTYSLTHQTEWVYDILKELGFTYSSSVLPAKNPLYGWPQFGETPKITASGILEIPITVGRIGPLTIPSVGGIYFRVLPEFIIHYMINNRSFKNHPLVGFFHPYDIDKDQEKFMHGGINNNRFYNWLMYYNRKNVLIKLNRLITRGYKIIPYNSFIHISQF